MPSIGETLREARMRQRLDIADVETRTKIRAKYLRALENEEFGMLPGPTFVKTFLRTYAEKLGLDARLLVEEYKLRHERLSDVDLQPIAPRSARDRARERRTRSRVPRLGLVGLPECRQDPRQVHLRDEHLARLGALVARDDPAPLEHVDQAAGARVADAQTALEQ